MVASVSGYYAWRARLSRSAIIEEKASGGLNQRLLLGEPKAVWRTADQSGDCEIRHQSGAVSDSARDV